MKRDLVYLRHILDAINKIESYVAVGRNVFMTTSHWQDAVVWPKEFRNRSAREVDV